MATMVDSCIYLDVFTRDPVWSEWSANAMADAADRGTIVLNSAIYAEISVRFDRIEQIEAILPADTYVYHEIPREAAFLAGKCFLRYRRRGGTRTAPLPNFFIGAHAAVAGIPLVTRDPARFREYFPALRLVAP